MQNDNNKEVMHQVINKLCHDEVIFQHCKNLNDPAKIRNVKDILIEFNKRGYLDNQGRWSAKIDCPDLKAPHVTRQAVDVALKLKYLPGCAEECKPDIFLVPYNPLQPLVQDWHQAVSLVKMKQHGVDVQKQEWFDKTAKCTNTIWGCQDAHTFVIMLQYFGEQFAFSFFDRGGAICPDMLNIMDDKEEYLRLVLYLSLADPSMVCLEMSIVHNDVGQFVQSKVVGLVPIEMVLFISNNLHGRETMARHVTLTQCRIAEALQSVGTWEVMKKWLKGMEDDVAVVVKDTWVNLTAPHTEGMILNYLRLKGVMGVAQLLFEGLVAGPAIPPSLDQLHNHPGIGSLKDIGAITQTGGLNVWCSTVYNWSFLGVSTLALAHKSMTKSVNAYDRQHPIHEGSESKLKLITCEVYQERMLTQSWLYLLCTPIYEFSCVYEALVGIADCIKSHGQAFSPYCILENGSETNKLFPISFMQADTSMWNMGLVRPTLSDWGAVDPTELGENNEIRQGLLYDHAFASCLLPKIFTAHTPLVPAPASSIPHALSIPAHTPSPNTPPQCPPIPHAPSIPAHTPSPNTKCPPVPLFDTASTSMVPSQPDVPYASAPPPNLSLPLRGGRGTGRPKYRGRSGGGRKGTTETITGEVSPSTAASGQPPSDSVSSCLCKRTLTSSADNPPKRLACYVPKVHIKPKDVVQSLQVDIAGYGSPTTDEDLERFADKGGIYELTGTRTWMAIQTMLAQQPGTDVIRREIVHDLEGYYYVILTLAFMFDGLYALKKVPNTDMASGAEMWLHRWLENTIEMEIWQEAVEKQHYLGTNAGFSMVEGLLGEDWAIKPVKMMLKEMREHLFTNAAPTHSGMLDIITNALVKIRTNPDLAHLCKPQKMTMEWAKATGGNGVPSRSSILPTLRMNLLYHKEHQDPELNLFACMPCPLVQERRVMPGTSSQANKPTGGRTVDHMKWYKLGKRRELDRENDEDMDEFRIEGLPNGLADEVDEALFHLIPLGPDRMDHDAQDMMDVDIPIHDDHPVPGPSRHPHSLQAEGDTRVTESHPTAGRVIRIDQSVHAKWRLQFGLCNEAESSVPEDQDDDSLFYPFTSRPDWQVGCWAVQEGIGHKAFDRLLAIPEVKDCLGLAYHNTRGLHQTIDSIPPHAKWTLLGNPAHAKDIIYKPATVFTDDTHSSHIYNEMWTGRWWHAVQDRLPEGASVVPVIIVTDKTQLTRFSASKSAYSVYLTLGYLSVDKILKNELSAREVSARVHHLFHASLHIILDPLKEAGKEGIEVVGEMDLFAWYSPSLPAMLPTIQNNAWLLVPSTVPVLNAPWTASIIDDANISTTTNAAFRKQCMLHDVAGGVFEPFWLEFPHCDIHLAITSDVLHQLYQGMFKHMVEWCQELMDEEELDQRLCTLPPCYGVRHFHKGWTSLGQIGGKERKHMARVLLACLVGKVPRGVILAYRALLDFIYLSQYPTHDDTTLEYMQQALKDFHHHKEVIINLGIRDNLDIPKFHSLQHYLENIQNFGTTDNYNTEMFERFHIDFCKEGWYASNGRNEKPQMIAWLTRREKVASFQSYLQMTMEDEDEEFSHSRFQDQHIILPKSPHQIHRHIADIMLDHSCNGFKKDLIFYLNTQVDQPYSRAQLQDIDLPLSHIDIYHGFKFCLDSLGNDVDFDYEELDTVKAKPPMGGKAGCFDTVVVMDGSNCESTGLQG
ncbi:uncharacterized protein EDB91DRAFT_1249522 [Suillus paluster]|uniref:uncharacterized protein n=1 Tax=Suillus paluster TaxID=48578 RepID=UPI001B88693D|nr:uncharacterized protein EDB91DRAFT_1249522 [Suillus paluster]KAG1737845.1 hypothetical protein EDB91DRAFT_1249522 [Suillus paluster]